MEAPAAAVAPAEPASAAEVFTGRCSHTGCSYEVNYATRGRMSGGIKMHESGIGNHMGHIPAMLRGEISCSACARLCGSAWLSYNTQMHAVYRMMLGNGDTSKPYPFKAPKSKSQSGEGITETQTPPRPDAQTAEEEQEDDAASADGGESVKNRNAPTIQEATHEDSRGVKRPRDASEDQDNEARAAKKSRVSRTPDALKTVLEEMAEEEDAGWYKKLLASSLALFNACQDPNDAAYQALFPLTVKAWAAGVRRFPNDTTIVHASYTSYSNIPQFRFQDESAIFQLLHALSKATHEDILENRTRLLNVTFNLGNFIVRTAATASVVLGIFENYLRNGKHTAHLAASCVANVASSLSVGIQNKLVIMDGQYLLRLLAFTLNTAGIVSTVLADALKVSTAIFTQLPPMRVGTSRVNAILVAELSAVVRKLMTSTTMQTGLEILALTEKFILNPVGQEAGNGTG